MLFAEVRFERSPAGRQSGVLASKESPLAVVSYKTTLNINGVGVGGRKDSMDVMGSIGSRRFQRDHNNAFKLQMRFDSILIGLS